MTLVLHRYYPIKGRPRTRRKLSEKQLRKRLEDRGYVVWRGGAIHILRFDELYPAVFRKYAWLHKLLEKYHSEYCEYLEYLCAVHHGMPDFLCFKGGQFVFVECKLGHEQLSQRQKKCFALLSELGFAVEVHKLVDPCTKIRRASINLVTGKKKILERQLTL